MFQDKRWKILIKRSNVEERNIDGSLLISRLHHFHHILPWFLGHFFAAVRYVSVIRRFRRHSSSVHTLYFCRKVPLRDQSDSKICPSVCQRYGFGLYQDQPIAKYQIVTIFTHNNYLFRSSNIGLINKIYQFTFIGINISVSYLILIHTLQV